MVHTFTRDQLVLLLSPSKLEGKLSHNISLSHRSSPPPLSTSLSFYSFCLRVLWSGRRDLGEPGFVRTLSVSTTVH